MLTPAGRDAAERARSIIAEVEQMKEAARRTQNPEAGTVRLGIFPTLGPYLLPHVVPRIRERFPQLELLLIEEKTDRILRQLREGKLDVGVLALPLHDEQLHLEYLFEEPFLLAVPEGHALAKLDALSMRDLAHESLLLLEDGHCMREQSLDVCHLAGASEKTGFRATSLETLRQMVAANVGITLLPMLAVKPPVAPSRDVHVLPFRDPPPTRRIAMVWRRSSAMSDFLSKLADLFRHLPDELLSATPKPPAPVGKPRKSAS
jgi:LysR family hydrogen peroxide-inducible transcriptional activator